MLENLVNFEGMHSNYMVRVVNAQRFFSLAAGNCIKNLLKVDAQNGKENAGGLVNR